MSIDLPALRDYQREAIDAIHVAWKRGVKRPAVVLPTGAGKTYVFAHLIREFFEEIPNKRVIVLAHTDELVTQAAKEVKKVAPHLPVGIVKGARNDVWAPVIVASVQSLRAEKRRNQIHDVGLIIIDECHHSTSVTYRNILEHFGAFDPESDLRTVGVTATLARSDGAALNTVWEEAIFTRDILFMIQQGYLLDIKGVSVEVPDLDLSAVKKSRGDFQDGDLGRAMTESLAPELVAKAYVEHANNRFGLMFWPTVEAAYVGAEAMNALGVRTEVVHGGLRPQERRDILARFESGEIQVVSNCMVLTEGFNAPWASCVVVCRPTRSRPLFQQMVGRALRLWPGQTEALLIDVCGTTKTNDLRCLVDLADKDIREVKEGQTLTEAVREEEIAVVAPYHGPVEFVEVDPDRLFGGVTKRVWMTTQGGTKFLTWGEKRCLFLVPSVLPGAPEGTWDVAWCVKSRTPWPMPDGTSRLGDFTQYRAVGLEHAIRSAEALANELGDDDGDFGRKDAGWRKRPANQKQIDLARRYGCDVPEGITGGEISEMIDGAIASKPVDFYVGKIMGMRK